MTDIFKDFLNTEDVEEDSPQEDLDFEEDQEYEEESDDNEEETIEDEPVKRGAATLRTNIAGKKIRKDGNVAKKPGRKPAKKKTGPKVIKKVGRPPKVIDKRTLTKKVLTGHELNKILGLVLQGKTQKEIAAEFSVALTTIFKWMHSSPKVEEAIAAARKESALHILERATEIALDDSKNFYQDGNGNLVPNAVNVQHRKLAVSQLNRVAGLYNPDQFSEKQAGVNVNVGMGGTDQNGNSFGFVIYAGATEGKEAEDGAVEIMCDLSGTFKRGDKVVQEKNQIIDITPNNEEGE